MRERLPVLAAALWWGSLSAMGFVAVPMLFVYLPTPSMAGQMAARLFEAQTYISIACCACLLVLSKRKHAETEEQWARAAMVFVILGLLLALLVQYGVAPRIVARQDLKFWHGLGTLLYTLQWACALVTLWHTLRKSQPPQD